jgi:transposase
MKHYIGLDVSLQTTVICIVDETGKRIMETSTQTTADAIEGGILRAGKISIEKICLETGSMCHHLVEELKKKGFPIICVDARHAAAFLSLKYNKTDKNDARGLAESLRVGCIKEVQTKTAASLAIPTLLKARKLLVEQRKQIQLSIRGHLKTYGLKMKSLDGMSFVNEVTRLIQNLHEVAIDAIMELMHCYIRLVESVKKMDRKIKGLCKEKEAFLMTIPGVGPITALTFTSEIGDEKRFNSSRQVGAYVGMTPKQYSSGEIEQMGRISKTGPTYLRCLLVEAGMTILTKSKKWSKLKAWGLKIRRKSGTKKAAVAVGRKLAIIMHRMLITGEEFRYTDEIKEENKAVA